MYSRSGFPRDPTETNAGTVPKSFEESSFDDGVSNRDHCDLNSSNLRLISTARYADVLDSPPTGITLDLLYQLDPRKTLVYPLGVFLVQTK